MNTPAKILELPLHLVGISDQVARWLREAGVPVVRLGQESAVKSAFGLKRRRIDQPISTPVRCLLFDSRDLWSRTIVKSHQKNSCSKLDIAPLLTTIGQGKLKPQSQGDITNPVRFVFLEQLKNAIESLGGVWARLADYPFPYQGVGCLNCDLSNGISPAGKHSHPPHRLDHIQQRYIAGLPTTIAAKDLSRLAELPPVTGLQSRGLPLLWRANQTDFVQWWQHRNHLAVNLWQSSTQYHIQCPKTNTSFCPVLEIWRGNHLASVPMRSESMVVRKDGLVFQQQPARHPAGFTAGWPDTTYSAEQLYRLA